jgi:N,N'-diacetyllegionaminate synthase
MNGTDFSKVFIIAEAGVNHNGSLERAYQLVDVAVEAGADAIKFQTFRAENVVTTFAEKAEYQKEATGPEESQFEMIKKLELSFGDFGKIKKYCDKKHIMFLSTPFDCASADFLEELVPVYKVGSGEITNLPFLEYIAKKGKPILLSTGMSTIGEIEEAMRIILPACNASFSQLHTFDFKPLTLLHCVSTYPTDYDDVNLYAMITLREAFKVPVGYSDHTLGIEIPVAAVALGAQVIEKHFTLDKNLPGPDHRASLEPEELTVMVHAIRKVERALGEGVKRPTYGELEVMRVARRSLVAKRGIRAGEVIKEKDIAIKRPGTGISPQFKNIIIGMALQKDIRMDEPFTWEHFK